MEVLRGQVLKKLVCSAKEFGLTLCSNGKLLEEFKHGSDMIKFKFCKVNPGSR